MNYSFVEVVWHDAHAYRERWLEPEDIDREPLVVCTAGYLIPEAKPDHVTIVQSVNGEGSLDGIISVPCSMVQEVRVISGEGRVPFSPTSA